MGVPYAELKDKYGNNINFGHFGDILIPAFPMIEDFRQHKADIREMNLKPTDVLLTGYLKAGTYLRRLLLILFSIVQELCESRGGRPELSVLTSLLVSVDIKIY